MNLAKALKSKNRLSQKIKELEIEIQTENSARADADRKIDVAKLVGEHNNSVDNLIKLKVAIFVASTPMRETILRLGELKSKIMFLKGINVTEGKVSNYGEGEIEYSVIYDKINNKDEVKRCEDMIDNYQEQLDEFNHKTEIEINVTG